MKGVPYSISFRSVFIDYEEYIIALAKLRSTYPYIPLMKARAKIFEEGVKALLK